MLWNGFILALCIVYLLEENAVLGSNIHNKLIKIQKKPKKKPSVD